MNGADRLLETAANAGLDICFANPGTTELHLVEALQRTPQIRPVLGLFEGVCSGAADGYARMAQRPALTLTHLGPGFANALANLHNARRAHSPVVNVIGDHATWHAAADAPLTSDIKALAGPMSDWVGTASLDEHPSIAMANAINAATAAPGGVASLIVPQDVTWAANSAPGPDLQINQSRQLLDVSAAAISETIAALRRPGCAMLLDNSALATEGLRSAAAIAQATDCLVFHACLPARMSRGRATPAITRLPYVPTRARAMLSEVATLILVGATEPHSFFGYEGQPSKHLNATTQILSLGDARHNLPSALRHIAESLQAKSVPYMPIEPDLPSGELTVQSLGMALAALQPEGTILVDEATTSGGPAFEAAAGAAPHDWLGLTGGAIGAGLPLAVGAALAEPDRAVIALEADGSSLYTIQSLWTMAREGLDVTVVVCANRRYRILQGEMHKAGMNPNSEAAQGLTSLADPTLDFVSLAEGFGLPANQATTADEFVAAMRIALNEPGPHLIEALLP